MSDGAQKIILVGCSDGRLRDLVEMVREELNGRGFSISPTGVYRIRIPGPDGIFNGSSRISRREALREDLNLLIEKVRPTAVVLAGHEDCAGHPVSSEDHTLHVVQGSRIIGAWVRLPVFGFLCERRSDDEWRLQEVVASLS